MIHAFIGVCGSGKDWRANKLADQGLARVDFKDPLLDMASDLVGYDVRGACVEDYDWFKAMPIGVRRPGNPLRANIVSAHMIRLMREHPEIMTGRRLLTRLGTEVMRKRDENYWVKAFVEKAKEAYRKGCVGIAVADCRFKNEVEAVRDFDVSEGETHRFTFCDFRSHRYNPKLDHGSERLAQTLLSMGLEDGDKITGELFQEAFKFLRQHGT